MERYGFGVGDFVRVVKREGDERIIFEGFVMLFYEFFLGEIFIIKFDNGYNIGILIDVIEGIEIFEKVKEVFKMEFREVLLRKEGFLSVIILGMGGIIVSRIDYKIGVVYVVFIVEELVKVVLEIFDIVNIMLKFFFNIMSEDMKFEYWKKIVYEVVKVFNFDEDGVVIVYGMDIMGYIVVVFSFMLRNFIKFVVFVGF